MDNNQKRCLLWAILALVAEALFLTLILVPTADYQEYQKMEKTNCVVYDTVYMYSNVNYCGIYYNFTVNHVDYSEVQVLHNKNRDTLEKRVGQIEENCMVYYFPDEPENSNLYKEGLSSFSFVGYVFLLVIGVMGIILTPLVVYVCSRLRVS